MPATNRRKFLKIAGLTAASTALAACSTAPQPVPTRTTAIPARPTNPPATAEKPTLLPDPILTADLPDLAVIVLNRLAFGPKPEDFERFNALAGDPAARLAAYLDEQLNPDRIDDSAFETRLAAAGYETLQKPITALYADHIVNNPYDDNDDRHWQWFTLPADETAEATFLRAVYSRKQLQELLADFWHNHFNVYGWHEELAPLFASYDRDAIRPHLFGNFRQFLETVTSHPSMLYYLDNRSNSDAGPNENFARELFELHTLGAENYLGVRDPASVPRDAGGLATGFVDNDIYEAARCFTGWRVADDQWEGEDDVERTGEFLYYKPWHDRFNKLILGRYIPADQPDLQDGRQVLDLLAAHPGTAAYICRKLCIRFIGDNPPESAVKAAAGVFLAQKDAPDQLRQVYQTILTSPEFRQTWGAKIKRPFEQAAAMLRALNADFTRLPGGAAWTYQMMGEPLFGHHPPDGYADEAPAWANTMSTLYGWNLTVGITENWWNEEEEGKQVLVDVWAQTPAELTTPARLVDFWMQRILGYSLTEAQRAAVIDFIAAGADPDDNLSDEERNSRLPGMVELILMSPEFRLR